MSIMVDWQIRDMSVDDGGVARPCPLLSPFVEGVQDGVISYGLTSSGYDLRMGHKVLIFKNTFNEVMDPKRFRQDSTYFHKVFDRLDDLETGERVILPPHSYLLAYSLEYIRMPTKVSGTCVGKSTYARCGIIVNTTPLEPEWEGHLTIEIGNISPAPVAIYAGEGIAQVRFEKLDSYPESTYKNKGGKYQKQAAEPIPARLKE